VRRCDTDDRVQNRQDHRSVLPRQGQGRNCDRDEGFTRTRWRLLEVQWAPLLSGAESNSVPRVGSRTRHRAMMLSIAATAGYQVRFGAAFKCWRNQPEAEDGEQQICGNADQGLA